MSAQHSAEARNREYPDRPIVGVGAVVVRPGDQPSAAPSVVVVRRGSHPGFGEWSIPGGAVELGETLREAAAREVLEECAIVVAIGDVVEVIDRVVRDATGRVQYHFVLIDFVACYQSGTLQAASDILEARWVPASDLGNVGLPDSTLKVVRKALTRQVG